MSLLLEQKLICDKYGVPFIESPKYLKVGISLNVKEGTLPINGLRHNPIGDTTGWYIWAGEYSDDPDFFKPLHVEHIKDWIPWLEKYLGLAPGWRFLVTPEYEDIWEDLSLL
jgi:hypothetical protein